MPRINWPRRSLGAICYQLAHTYELELRDDWLCAAIKDKVPESQVIRGWGVRPMLGIDGQEVSGEKLERCLWIRLGEKDCDVLRMSQNRRAQLQAKDHLRRVPASHLRPPGRRFPTLT